MTRDVLKEKSFKAVSIKAPVHYFQFYWIFQNLLLLYELSLWPIFSWLVLFKFMNPSLYRSRTKRLIWFDIILTTNWCNCQGQYLQTSFWKRFLHNVWSLGLASNEWGSIQMSRFWKFSRSSALNTVLALDHLFLFKFLWLFTNLTLNGPFGTVDLSFELLVLKVRNKVQFKCLDLRFLEVIRS